MVSTHAQENARKYLNPQYTNKAAALRFQDAVNQALHSDESTAVCLTLDNAVENPYRDDWKLNDVLCGIVREHTLVTVMLTRTEQVNTGHLRTDSIVIA